MAINEGATTNRTCQQNGLNNTLCTFAELLYMIFASLHSPQHRLPETK
jgi:hypothetical protein